METNGQASFNNVRETELNAIQTRRAAAELKPSNPAASDETVVQKSAIEDKSPATVGLALSGGGIRSACVGLGLMQAFYRRGILRQVDYLSTVSGGGFVGAYLSSFLSTCKGTIDWEPHKNAESRDRVRLPFYSPPGAPQSPDVRKLANRGEEFKQPIKFLSRHLWGLITVNLFVFSGLVAIGALAAYLFRLLDKQQSMWFLSQLGFRDDFGRAFFPAFVLFGLWLVSIAVSAFLRQKKLKVPQISSVLYALLVLSLIMGFVSLLSTRNVSFNYFETIFGVPHSVSDSIRTLLNWLSNGALVVFAVAMAPYLNLNAVIRSGTNPRNRVESWVFNLASSALLFGSPLLVFYVLSHENISGWNERRPLPNSMSPSHIAKWPAFWRELKEPVDPSRYDSDKWADLGSKATPGDVIWKWLKDEVKLPGEQELATPALGDLVQKTNAAQGLDLQTQVDNHPMAKCVFLEEGINRHEKTLWFWNRWLRFGEYLIGTGDAFEQQLANSVRLSRWKEAIVQEFNRACLSDPSFYICFEKSRIASAVQLASVQEGSKKLEENLESFKPYEELPEPLLANPTTRRSVIATLFKYGELLRAEVKRMHDADKQIVPNAPPPNSNRKEPDQLLRWLLEPSKIQPAEINRKDSYQLWKWLLDEYERADREYQSLRADSTLISDEDRESFQVRMTRAESRFQRLRQLLTRVQGLNWNLTRAFFGKELIYPQSEVFAIVVMEQDQARRLKIFGISLVLFVALGMFFSVNPTLLHGFYRDQLAALWLHPHPEFGLAIPLHKMKNCERGGPLHLINGALNLFGRRRDQELDPLCRFTFSQTHVGAKRVGYCPTEEYMHGTCDLADTMAISGAAVSPTSIDNMLVRALLVLFNLRLGQWLHHPNRPPGDLSWPSPLQLLWGFLMVEPHQRNYLFISDGGHDENTGIGALLERRCRVIIACDASQDGDFQFADFRKLLSASVNKYGIRLWLPGPQGRPVTLDELTPDEKTKLSKRHFLVFRIEYPNDDQTRRSTLTAWAGPDSPLEERSGFLVYIKPTLTGDESPELLKFRVNHNHFPHDPTLDQFFESARFLAYRQLGEHIGDDVCDQLFKSQVVGEKSGTTWLADEWQPVWPEIPSMTPVLAEPAPEIDLHSLNDLPFTWENAARVLAMLRHPSVGVRHVACTYLCEYGVDASPELKSQAIEALRQVLIDERDVGVRIELCKALSWVGEDRDDVEKLLRSRAMDESEDSAVRSVCEMLVASAT